MAGRKPCDAERFRGAFRELGRRIAKHRKDHEWTQHQLADHCGMSTTAISDIERAEAFPTMESLFVLAVALNVSSADLIQGLDSLVLEPSEFVKLPY